MQNTPIEFTSADGRALLRYPDGTVRPADESRMNGLRRVAAEQVKVRVVTVWEPKPLPQRLKGTRREIAQREVLDAMNQGREAGTFDKAFIGFGTARSRYGRRVEELAQRTTGQKAA